ncbi:Transcription factor Sp8 [Thelohanellus kitauei]|uniref:Transcription factor Sp8 n=1 Tax=Thelohanellus kitauei TaxID=669202 RepID=A0A0C2MHM5_THEKT|nr:Transcription factor Sp8 [Thelohanellus kitauei]
MNRKRLFFYIHHALMTEEDPYQILEKEEEDIIFATYVLTGMLEYKAIHEKSQSKHIVPQVQQNAQPRSMDPHIQGRASGQVTPYWTCGYPGINSIGPLFDRLGDPRTRGYFQSPVVNNVAQIHVERMNPGFKSINEPGLYPCKRPGCGLVYQKRTHLLLHMKSHDNESRKYFQWVDCNKEFPKVEIPTHSIRSLVENTLECKFCDAKFNRINHLLSHVKRRHSSNT